MDSELLLQLTSISILVITIIVLSIRELLQTRRGGD